MIYCRPKVLSADAWQAIEEWEQRENAVLYAFILDEETIITRDLVHWACQDECDKVPADRIDVLVQSTGGDIEAAYKLIVHLRARCKQLRMFVPHYAKSAATFFTLGADEIWLGTDAELGPLDAQIFDPRHPDRRMSALEQFQAIDYLRQHGYEMLDQFIRVVVQCTRMNIEDILTHGVQYTTQMMQSLYKNIDPLDFGAAHRSLMLSEEYGRRVMKRYAYKGVSPDDVNDMIQALTWDYPSHSFVIDYAEAKRVGLKVFEMGAENQHASKFIVDSIHEALGFFGGKPEDEADDEQAKQPPGSVPVGDAGDAGDPGGHGNADLREPGPEPEGGERVPPTG